MFLLLCLYMSCSSQALSVAYQQQPELTCSSLEAAVRGKHLMSAILISSHASDAKTEEKRDVMFAKRVLLMCEYAALQLQSTAQPATAAAAAAAAVGRGVLGVAAVARQLFALAVSCLKLASVRSEPRSWQLQVALAVTGAAVSAAAALGTCGGGSGEAAAPAASSSSSSDTMKQAAAVALQASGAVAGVAALALVRKVI
jgi:hypothetical protein